MGCFSKRRGMVTHLPARFHILVTALRVRVTRPSRNAATSTLIRAGSFAGSFLPATRLVLARAICEDRGIGGRGSDLPGAIKLRNVLDCQAKILEAVMDSDAFAWCRPLHVIHCHYANPRGIKNFRTDEKHVRSVLRKRTETV